MPVFIAAGAVLVLVLLAIVARRLWQQRQQLRGVTPQHAIRGDMQLNPAWVAANYNAPGLRVNQFAGHPELPASRRPYVGVYTNTARQPALPQEEETMDVEREGVLWNDNYSGGIQPGGPGSAA